MKMQKKKEIKEKNRRSSTVIMSVEKNQDGKSNQIGKNVMKKTHRIESTYVLFKIG